MSVLVRDEDLRSAIKLLPTIANAVLVMLKSHGTEGAASEWHPHRHLAWRHGTGEAAHATTHAHAATHAAHTRLAHARHHLSAEL